MAMISIGSKETITLFTRLVTYINYDVKKRILPGHYLQVLISEVFVAEDRSSRDEFRRVRGG
jgi:hypothetical protein